MKFIALLAGLTSWVLGLTPYEIYCYNFGDCVESCMSRGIDEKRCNYRCWQTWKFYLSGKYTIKDGEVVEVEEEENGGKKGGEEPQRVVQKGGEDSQIYPSTTSEPVAVAIVVDKNGEEERKIASTSIAKGRVPLQSEKEDALYSFYDVVY